MKNTLNIGLTEVPIPMVLQKLSNSKTKITKKKLIRKLWDNDDEELFLGLDISLDNSIQFNVKTVPLWDDDDDGTVVLNFNTFYEFCMLVKFNKISQDDINSKILELANASGTNEWNNFYRLILLKKLQLTLPMKEISEVMLEIKNENEKHKNTDASIILKRR